MLAPGKPEGPAGQTRGAVSPPPRRPGEQPAGPAGLRERGAPSALMREIRELGGIDQRELQEVTGEKRFGKVKGLPWGVFRPQKRTAGGRIAEGLGLDDIASQLRAKGWDIPEDNEVAALTKMLDDEIRGGRSVRLGEESEVMTSAALLREMDELHGQFTEAETLTAEKFGFRQNDPGYIAEIQRIRQQRDAAMAEVMRTAENPLQAEAARLAQEKPNLKIRTGEDSEGKPVTTSLRQYLEDAGRAAEKAAEDAKLFDIAAACLEGGG